VAHFLVCARPEIFVEITFLATGESGKASIKRASYINDEPTNLNFDEARRE
jgi:hypothetical protein